MVSAPSRPLDGLRVADLTRFVAGSYCTGLLAALGADVVKVEPLDGDPYRKQGMAMLFQSLNAGKRSVALDFRTAEGLEVLERLVASADFFVQNARPGAMSRLGLDWDALHERYPRLVAASISGYGDTGPDAEKGGFDLTVQADSGIMSVTGSATSGPVKIGAPLLDVGAGTCAALGLLAAHVERLATGRGRLVSTSLLEFALAGLGTVAAEYLSTGVVPGLLGTHSPIFAPYGGFRTGDGWLILAGAGSEDLWRRLCTAIGADGLLADDRFSDNARRVAHRAELTGELEAVFEAQPTAHWMEQLATAGVPASKVRSLDEVLWDRQVGALDVIEPLPNGRSEESGVVGPPIRIDHERPKYQTPAPALGANTDEVLLELGYTAGEIDHLATRGAIARG